MAISHQRLIGFHSQLHSPLTVSDSSRRPPLPIRASMLRRLMRPFERDQLIIAVHAAADGGHREVGVELARQLERDVAAHGVEREIAASRELVACDFDVAAHAVGVDRGRAQAVELNVAAHRARRHVALGAGDGHVAAHELRRHDEVGRNAKPRDSMLTSFQS